MQYTVRHITRFTYDAPIRESRMEVRMRPRTESEQLCYSFDLAVSPHTQVFAYQDYIGNTVHYFDIPETHDTLTLTSRALVEVRPAAAQSGLDTPPSWRALDEAVAKDELLDMILPSTYAHRSPMLESFAEEMAIRRTEDPLRALQRINHAIYTSFSYVPKSTHVNSAIDDAFRNRSGVCQDFAHIFIALSRLLQIPCRYVSGYLFHRPDADDDHNRSAEDGSHAWVEAYLPEVGWLGFDPTNNTLADERHIRVAIGRDYADVPPTRGIYKGTARSTLHVGVSVAKARFPVVREDPEPNLALVAQAATETEADRDAAQRMAQQ